jgi:hypothetical protein
MSARRDWDCRSIDDLNLLALSVSACEERPPRRAALIEWLDIAICSIRSASPIRGRICECTYSSTSGDALL